MIGRDRTRGAVCRVGSRRAWPVILAAVLVAVSVGLVGCGGGGLEGIAHPLGGSEVVLQVTKGGGFVPIEYQVTLVPEFSLYGDGRVIVPGPQMEIYPRPALPAATAGGGRVTV